MGLREALSATTDAWARAYLGEPAERGEIAVSVLAPFLLGEAGEPVEVGAVMVA